MTVRDVEHHLASTLGTGLSREMIPKITDENFVEGITWERVVSVLDGSHSDCRSDSAGTPVLSTRSLMDAS